MDYKKKIEEIKALFSLVPPVAPVELGTDYPLADGSVINIDKLEVGGAVTKDGSPAPDGDYQLADGSVLKVSGGLIAEIVAQDAPPDDLSQFKSEFAAFKNDFILHKEAFNQVSSDFKTAKETIGKQDEAIKGLLEVVQKLSETPVTPPVQEQKSFESMTALERYRATK